MFSFLCSPFRSPAPPKPTSYVSVIFDKEEDTCRPGDTISGTINIEVVKRDVLTAQLICSGSGKEKVYCELRKTETEVSPGKYSFVFSFEIPKNCSPSFKPLECVLVVGQKCGPLAENLLQQEKVSYAVEQLKKGNAPIDIGSGYKLEFPAQPNQEGLVYCLLLSPILKVSKSPTDSKKIVETSEKPKEEKK